LIEFRAAERTTTVFAVRRRCTLLTSLWQERLTPLVSH